MTCDIKFSHIVAGLIDIEHYSVTYFEHITEFDVL